MNRPVAIGLSPCTQPEPVNGPFPESLGLSVCISLPSMQAHPSFLASLRISSPIPFECDENNGDRATEPPFAFDDDLEAFCALQDLRCLSAGN